VVSLQYNPPPLPVKLCAEVAWEIIHTPVLSREHKTKVLYNLSRRCGKNLIPPGVLPPSGWY